MSNQHNRATGLAAGLRWRIFGRDNFTCRYCGATPPDVVLQVDHVQPRSRGGSDDESNLVTACQSCNIGKFDKELQPQPVKPAYTEPQQAFAMMLAARDQFPEVAALFQYHVGRQLEHLKARDVPLDAATCSLLLAALRTAAMLWHQAPFADKTKRQFIKFCSTAFDEEPKDG